jgi:HEAT repeat protein
MAMRDDNAAVTAVLDRLDRLPPELLAQTLAALAQLCRRRRGRLPPGVMARIQDLPFGLFLDDDRERVRTESIRVIGALGSDSHLTTLVERLDSMTRRERRLALESLAEMPGAKASEVLVMLSESDDPAVAARALEYLRSA